MSEVDVAAIQARFEMIERVAEALFHAEHPMSEWSAGRARMKWFSLAEVAIRAMREPTKTMMEAGDQWTNHHADCVYSIWQAMIGAALLDTEEGATK